MSQDRIILIILAFWLVVLSSVVLWLLMFFRRLSKDLDKGNLIKLLERVIAKGEMNSKEIVAVNKAIKDLKVDAVSHIQKVGMVRFNPFEEMGGDHSFSLAILDGAYTGFVITGLHTRERTRVYVKSIEKGKSNSELSKEESEAVIKAQKS